MPRGNNARAKAAQYRQSEKGRMTRRMYNMLPEVRARKAIHRAVKHHLTPPAIQVGTPGTPGTPKVPHTR